jgi:hypothetical protein
MSRPGRQPRQQTLVFGGHKSENQAQAAFAFFVPGFREAGERLRKNAAWERG